MNEKIGTSLLRAEFQNITGLVIEDWRVEPDSRPGRADVRLLAGGEWYAAEFKAAATTEQVSSALRQLSVLSEPERQVVPLLVVPYMGNAGRELCRAAGIPWLDLSGNAEIDTPSLRIRILGQPNKYKRSGQPQSLFAPRSARAARVFLMDVQREWLQTQLAEATGLSAGYLSRLLPRYVEAGFIQCRQEGRSLRYRTTHPEALLDAWYADYDFDRHTILRGHVAARSGTELLRELATMLTRHDAEYAATGLAAAWMWEPFAAFRTVTLYLTQLPSRELLSAIGFHEGARGSNTWLVVPDDPGVFTGVTERDGVRCVTPVQTYLDLKSQPECSQEARDELRRVHLSWANPTAESKPQPAFRTLNPTSPP
jgi:DNA-binding transcriptional ArsR family regulator